MNIPFYSRVSVLALLFVLTGCACDKLTEALPYLEGKSINYAINYMGLPQAENAIAGRKVYAWGHNSSMMVNTPVNSSFSGNVYGTGGSAYYQGSSTSYTPQMLNFYCTIRLATGADDIVQHWDWEGNEGGCIYFADIADRIIEDHEQQAKAAESINATEAVSPE